YAYPPPELPEQACDRVDAVREAAREGAEPASGAAALPRRPEAGCPLRPDVEEPDDSATVRAGAEQRQPLQVLQDEGDERHGEVPEGCPGDGDRPVPEYGGQR